MPLSDGRPVRVRCRCNRQPGGWVVRHLRSILYAFVLCPAIWTLSAVGFTRDLTGRARGEGTVETLSGLLLLLLAGAAYAILLLPRLSPAGPVLAGLVFLGAIVWVLIDRTSFDGLWPAGVRKEGFDLTLPADGLAALLAVPRLGPALRARRGRERDRRAALRIQPPFDEQVLHRSAGLDTIGLASAEATQVVSIGRPDEATQVITGYRPAGTKAARSRITESEVTAPVVAAQGVPVKPGEVTSAKTGGSEAASGDDGSGAASGPDRAASPSTASQPD